MSRHDVEPRPAREFFLAREMVHARACAHVAGAHRRAVYIGRSRIAADRVDGDRRWVRVAGGCASRGACVAVKHPHCAGSAGCLVRFASLSSLGCLASRIRRGWGHDERRQDATCSTRLGNRASDAGSRRFGIARVRSSRNAADSFVNAAHTRSVLLLVGAALCWSLAGVLIKFVATSWTGLAIASGRGVIAALFLLATNRGLRFHFSRVQVIGAIGYATCTITFCIATTLTSAANAILLQYTAPVWVALLGASFLGERSTRADWITIVVALGGMTLFFKDSLTIGHFGGDVLGVLSGVFFAGMTIALRRQKHGSPVESIILGNVLAFLIGLPWLAKSPLLPASGWVALAALGVVQLGVSYWLYARAIKHVTALEAVLIPVIEPILNPLWVLLFINEKPSRWAIMGGAVVLSAVTFRAVLSVRSGRLATTT
jgi:drug/metabolite transporter (DMT)-like permease